MKPQCIFIRHYSSYLSFNLNNTPSSKITDLLSLCKSGDLFNAINLLNSTDSRQILAKPIVYAALLQTSTKVQSFNHGLQLHSHVIKSGLGTDRFVGNSLLALYFKLGSNIEETRKVFDGLWFKDVIAWTSMISGYVRVGKSRNAVDLYWEMVGIGVEPNEFTLSCVIKACSEIGLLRLGKGFHGVVFRRGFDGNNVIVSALIDMYGSNSLPSDAHRMFDEMHEPDPICWTSVISAFTKNDLYEEALRFFYLMQRKYGFLPDQHTFGSILMACGNLGRSKQGKEVHAKIIVTGETGNVVVESSLVDMYGKSGLVTEARLVFDRMIRKNSVTWCALLGAYCHKGDFKSVIELFREMEVDLYSFGTVLRSCAGLAAVRQGKEVHSQYLRRGGWRDVIVESALLDVYSKCGCVDFAYRIFKQMSVRNLVSWNTMIVGLAQNGRSKETLKLLNDMIEEGLEPDYITFVGVLFACSHGGLVDEGKKYFNSMTAGYGIKVGVEHYNCMVDLLGRAGHIEEAESMLHKSDFRNDYSLWAALLGACATSRNSIVAEHVAKIMMELEPNNHLSYVLLANVYRDVGRWSDADNIRKLMQDRGVKKMMPGKSWIDIQGSLGLSFQKGYSDSPIQDTG
ncbi:hypothetical protein OROGR_020670 [Orobanche gracilis]